MGGYVSNPKEIIRMKSLLVKSEQQKEAVRTSPEFLRCTQEEQLERPLVDVCELVRHQAASVDEVRTELVVASYLRESPIYDLIVPNIANILKTLFVGHLIETPIGHVSATDLKIITKVSRVGTEAQLIIEYNGRRYEVRNIRIPFILKGVFPLSLRTPFLFVGLNRLTQLPAACHVAPTHIRTFDRKTYNYQMNNCFHVLLKDSTEILPIAVMARNLQGVSKEVKILAGVAEVLMTPISATNMKIQVNLNGQEQIVEVLPGEMKVIYHNGLEILHVKRFEDNVYKVHAVQEHLMVMFCGKHVQIFAPVLLRGRSCGLCGDHNKETTADLIGTIVLSFFSSYSLLPFFITYEFSLLPIAFLILLFGYQPEKISATVFLLSYTILCSLPLFYYVATVGGSVLGLGSSGAKGMVFLLGLAFMVKSPLYVLHTWLPKAHVEAPVIGSVLLSGIMLKLGGYGFLILSPYFNPSFYCFIYLSLSGSVISSLICFRHHDLKSVVAYSSVVHMGSVTIGAIIGSESGL